MCDRTFGEIVVVDEVDRRGARVQSASVRRAPPHSRVDHGAQDGTMLVFGPARVPGTRHAIDED